MGLSLIVKEGDEQMLKLCVVKMMGYLTRRQQ